MNAALRRPRGLRDGGFTLVELLVSLALFSVLLGIFGAALSLMFRNVRYQQGASDGLDASRKVLSLFDKQVRYANAIETPGTTGTAGSLTWWVEWQSGVAGQQQTCTQWQLQPSGQLRVRTWQNPLVSGGPITGMTAWSTKATRVMPQSGVAPFAFPPASVLLTTTRQQLVVSFLASYGAPVVKSPSSVTLTALNTTSSGSLLTSLCGGQRP